MRVIYRFFFVVFPTWWCCLISGLNYQKTWQLHGWVKNYS